MPGSREEDFWRNTSILHFLPQNYLPFGWGGHEIYNFTELKKWQENSKDLLWYNILTKSVDNKNILKEHLYPK